MFPSHLTSVHFYKQSSDCDHTKTCCHCDANVAATADNLFCLCNVVILAKVVTTKSHLLLIFIGRIIFPEAI